MSTGLVEVNVQSCAVSVIIATRNDCKRLGRAIFSVLEQTFEDFELIIVNDASEDETYRLLDHLASYDHRIKVANNLSQLGRAGARNVGLFMAKGEFIAILDSDDVMMPDRLIHQITFMLHNSNVGLIGSAAYLNIGDDFYITNPPDESELIKKILQSGQNNAIMNSSLFIRKSLILSIGGYISSLYSPNYNEDYFTFKKLVEYSQLSNIKEPLLIVSTDGIINPQVMKNKLTEMHNFEKNDIFKNFTMKRFFRLITRRIFILLPNFIISFLYNLRIKNLTPFKPNNSLTVYLEYLEEKSSIYCNKFNAN